LQQNLVNACTVTHFIFIRIRGSFLLKI